MQACTHTGCSLSACHSSAGQTGFQAVPVSSPSFSLALLGSCLILSESPLNAELTVLTPSEAHKVGVPVLGAVFTLS